MKREVAGPNGWSTQNLDFQQFLMVEMAGKFESCTNLKEKLQACSAINALSDDIKEARVLCFVG